jgi:transcriptional regulator with PAS, ATPase and Fis domain
MQNSAKEEDILKNIPRHLLFALLDNPYESLILIDNEGIIRFVSSVNEGVYEIPPAKAIGRHITEMSPRSKLPRVLKTGKAEIGQGMKLNEQQRVIARIPLTRDGQVIGALGKLLVKTPEQLKELYDRIETLERHLDYYREELNHTCGVRYSFDNIIGVSEPITKVKLLARQAAETDSSVVITGESGTGKELLAHAIHQVSRRKKNNFVKVNCSSLPNELIESELFGYEAGSFTGARKAGKPGKFELADRGTIFLDEIGDMPLQMQVKLMRVLQEKEIDRLGSSQPRNADFRVITATNRDLEKMIRDGAFRLDLYYRINVVTIRMPALRDIREDIPLIFNYFMEKLSYCKRQPAKTVSSEAMELLMSYAWPGNVRELRNIAERAMIVCQGNQIGPKDLPLAIQTPPAGQGFRMDMNLSLKELMEETERCAILEALQKTGNNRANAARLLGIHRTGLYQKMRKYGLE